MPGPTDSDAYGELPTRGDGPELVEDTAAGAPDHVDAELLLARARAKLLGWDEAPVCVGRYSIVHRLGTGGMGVVYAAHDDELDRDVAIKILRADLEPGSRGRQRLLREAQAIAKLSHPNVVHVYEVGQADGEVFMAMELVRGQTLRQWCQLEPRSVPEIVEMFARAGEGLAAAHAEGIVHRDFKPDNVLVGNDGRPRVVDFGLARARGDDAEATRETLPTMAAISGSHLRNVELTRTGTVMGTPAYMSPEQLDRAEPDARSDEFSFCAALFEALYGKRPFAGSTVSQVAASVALTRPVAVDPAAAGVPAAVHAAIMRGLAHAPAERFASMDALLAALRHAVAPPRPRARTWVAAALVTGLAAGALVLALDRDGPRAAAPGEPTATAPEDPWAAIVDATALPPVLETPLPGDPTGVVVHRLRNGLTVYIAHRPLEPFVSAAVVVRAGRHHEAEHEQGLGELALAAVIRGGARLGALDAERERPWLAQQHALLARLPELDDDDARMAVLQTVAAAELASIDAVAPRELDQATRALGGHDLRIDAERGVTLAADLPGHRVDAWLQLVAEALQRPSFRLLLDAAHERLDDLEQRWAYMGVAATSQRVLAPATGIHHDPQRVAETLAQVPLEATRDYYARYFRPNNTAIVLVGDITADAAIPMLERAFGAWAPAPIPVREAQDGALPQPRVRIDAEDSGPPSVQLTFALPPLDAAGIAAFMLLRDTVGGPEGLLHARLRDRVDLADAYLGYDRDFHVGAWLLPGQDHAEVEGLVMAALEAVAADALPDAPWTRALAQAALDRHRWARNAAGLRERISAAYLTHESWADAAAGLSAPPPARADVVAAARTLLGRDRVVAYARQGKPWRVDAPPLPRVRLPQHFGRTSAFAAALLEAPSTPLEPRFLVAGSHYVQRMHGAGRVITVAHDGPIFRLQWIYPTGAAEDPYLCDAVHAWVHAVPIAGVATELYCSNGDTRFDIVGPAAQFDALMPELVAWLDGTTMPDAVVTGYPAHALQWRADSARDPDARAEALHLYALRGEHGFAAHAPADDALRRHGIAGMRAAWVAAHAYDPDVLVVGPQPERVLAHLPRPRGRSHGGTNPRAFRSPPRQTVLVLHDPERDDASVQVALPWIATTPRASLAAAMHAEAVRLGEAAGPPTLDPVQPDFDVRWSPGAPLAIGAGFRAPAGDTALALRTALELLQRRLPEAEFAAAHRRLEIDFRAERFAASWIPELVRGWGPDRDDPRVAQWLALPSLSYADLRGFYEALAATQPLMSVAVDVDRIDLGALAEFGEVVLVDDDAMFRDPMFFEAGVDARKLAAE